jgi:hypothetical protein
MITINDTARTDPSYRLYNSRRETRARLMLKRFQRKRCAEVQLWEYSV